MGESKVTVRSASFGDAGDIFSTIRSHPDELVMRSKSDILQNIDRFLVAEVEGRVVGVVSWAILPELGSARHPSVEIKSLAVERESRGRHVGQALMDEVLRRVYHDNAARLIGLP